MCYWKCHDLDKYIIDQLLGSLSTFKILEIADIKREWKEVAFNVSKIVEDELEASENMGEIEENFVRRLKRETRKYEDNLPLKCFNCGRIGHYASKRMYKEDYKRSDDDEKKSRYKRYGSKKRTNDRDKGERSLCSMETHSSEDEDGDDSNEESLFVATEEKKKQMPWRSEGVKNNKNSVCEKIALHTKVELKAWIIDSRCSNHMTGDKEKFINHEKYDGGSMKFVGEEVAPICGIGSITIDGKHKTNDGYYVEGLRHNLLSFSQMCNKGLKSYLVS